MTPHRSLTPGLVSLLLGAALPAQQATSLGDIAGSLAGKAGTTVVYPARRILTMDAAGPSAEAVAVRDGRIVAVGTLAQVTTAAGAGATVDRTFADKIVVAGFVEQHVHPVLAALTMNSAVISIEDWDAIDGFSAAVRDEATYRTRLAAAVAAHRTAHPGGTTPFVTWGYHHYFHGKGVTRAWLDSLATDFPVVVWHRSAHEVFLNTRAIERAGIDSAVLAALPASARSMIELPKGWFYEQGAMSLMGRMAPLLATPERFRRGLEFSVAYYHRNGITTACEPGAFLSKPLQEAINAVLSSDTIPFNHCFIADGKSFYPANPTNMKALVADTRRVEDWGRGRTFYLPKQVKLFTDGAIYSQLMQMKDGYTDGHHGAWVIDPPVFRKMFDAYWDAGWQLHIHNNGDAGMDVLLDALAAAQRRRPRTNHRTVIVHFGFATAAQVARAARLGAIVSANPYYVTALAGKYAQLGVGPARSRRMVPMGDVVRHGMSFSFHSDMPMAPAKPLQLVWSAITRETAEGPVAGPEHRVTVEQALRAITIEAAYSIGLERDIGSVTVGKKANLTILEQDPTAVAPAAVKAIPVWGTMLEGRLQPAPRATLGVAPTTGHGAGGDTALGSALAGRLADFVGHSHRH